MPKTIRQKITFKRTPPLVLYDAYMNAKNHSILTGSEAIITKKEGSEFSAYDGYITGRNLQLIKDRLIVQSWRASDWNEEDIDSTLILLIQPKGKIIQLIVTHANVPDREYKNLSRGWHEHYWDHWIEQFEKE